MSIHIQTADGLKPLASNKITQENVVEALDYTPADKTELDAHIVNEDIHTTAADKAKWNAKSDFSGNYNDLTNKPNITDDGSDNLAIADPDGNVIFKVDGEGVHTTALEVDGVDVGATLKNIEDNYVDSAELDAHLANTTVHIDENERTAWNNKSDFSGNYNDLTNKPNITDDGSAEINIVDNDGNIIFKVDADGAQTTELTLGTGETAVKVTEKLGALGQDISLVNVALSGHTEDTTAHITAAERDTWNAKADTTYVDETVAEQIDSKANKTDLDGHITNTSNPHNVTATQVGLGLVDNTSDMDKPVSTATQEALDGLKTELSESIVSESKEWIIADEEGNIVAKVDENGLETTTVTADTVVVNGVDVEEGLMSAEEKSKVGIINSYSDSHGNCYEFHPEEIKSCLFLRSGTDMDAAQLYGYNDTLLTSQTGNVTIEAVSEDVRITASTDMVLNSNVSIIMNAGENVAITAPDGVTVDSHIRVDDYIEITDGDGDGLYLGKNGTISSANANANLFFNTNGTIQYAREDEEYSEIATINDIDNTKSELSESIVSESTEWTIVDTDGNIVSRVNSNGLETTTVTAQSVVVNGEEVAVKSDIPTFTYDATTKVLTIS